MITLDIETTGLYPAPPKDHTPSPSFTPDNLVAIGVMEDWGLQIFSAPIAEFKISLDGAEKRILKDFFNYFYEVISEDEQFLTYNGIFFDMPFIATRALHHGMSQEARDILAVNHIDLMEYSRHVTGKRLAKDDACRKLANLYVPRKTEGLWNARIYKNPQLLTLEHHLDMLQHNAIDLVATAKLNYIVKDFPDYVAWRSSLNPKLEGELNGTEN